MRRRPDWPERLAACVASARTRPFAWGRHDCALFVCDCIRAMTDVDPAQRFRGRYRTARGAGRALRRFGGVGTLAELATRVLGPSFDPARARRGDLVMLDPRVARDHGVAVAGESEPPLGVVLALRTAFVATNGMAFVPRDAASKAWRV